MRKKYSVDLPYPSFDGIEKDPISAKIIAPAYAGLKGELAATLQYVYHHYFFEETNEEIANALMGIAISEMHHLEILGKLLLKLGVEPIYSQCPPLKWNFYSPSEISYTKNPQKMLMDDIMGELLAIKEYEKMIKLLENEQVSAVISRIILDEELHVKVLKNFLGEQSCFE